MLSWFLYLLFISHSSAFASSRIALVSVENVAFDALDIGTEAISKGAKVLLFPEWGFYPQPNVSEATLNKWKTLADESNVYIAMGARYLDRNALFVFTPEGERHLAFRRDGHNSAPPTEPMYKKPLVIDTEYGRLGFLICDESRSRKYLDEIREFHIDAILSPNWIGTPVFLSEVLMVSANYWTDVYTTDVAGEKGNRTHVFRHSEGKVEFNSFGVDTEFSSPTAVKIHPSGLRYVISYHEIKKRPQ
jgi:hypothetical protein